MLSYYKEAVKDGWKPPVYKAEVTLQDKNREQITIPFEGRYYDLILFISKYLDFTMTSSWKIYEDNKKLSTEEVWKLIKEAEMQKGIR